MNFIILGDKFQKRMKSKGCIGLVQLNNKPIIEHQYKNIKKTYPSSQIIYVTGFESKKLTNYLDKNQEQYKDLIIVNNRYYDKYSYGYTLSLISQYLNTECFICLGDNPLKNILPKYGSKVQSKVFIDSQNKHNLGCIITDSVVENISYDLDNYLADVYYLTSEHSLILQKLVSNKRYYNCFLFELINSLIDQKQTFQPFDIG